MAAGASMPRAMTRAHPTAQKGNRRRGLGCSTGSRSPCQSGAEASVAFAAGV